MSRRSSLIAVALVALIATGFATTLVRLDFPAITQESEAIYTGKVVDVDVQWCRWCREVRGNEIICTWVTLEVYETLKGEPMNGKTIRIMVQGGQIGSDVVQVAGTPTFALGEDALVYLYRPETDPDFFMVEGWVQGKFSLAPDGKVYSTPMNQHIIADATPLAEVRTATHKALGK